MPKKSQYESSRPDCTCGSGAQHASVVDAYGAVGAAHSQVVGHQGGDGYRGGCPSTVYQDVLEKFKKKKEKKMQLGKVSVS